jgi:hypothetical protein
MNTPIAPVQAPPKPISVKKVVLAGVVGVVLLGGVVLASWEEGRQDLFAAMGFKGYRRLQADRLAVASKGNKPNFQEAFRLYQEDAEKGDGEALRKIGEMYRDGRGVPQSDAKARDSWNKAAASGDIGTLMWLAEKHRTGDGRALPVNHPEVVRLLRRAASQGDPAAQAKLARQLLSYVGEYQMKLDFDEVLSARQREELLTLQKIALLLKANNDGSVDKLNREQLNERVAGAIADLSEAIREKFQWEAYFWLSLSAASNDDADLRATRDGVAAKLKEKQVERVQGLVAKWSQSDAPGNAESPFVLDEGPALDAPSVNKQTLSALLQELSAKASKLPDPVPEAPKKPVESVKGEEAPGASATAKPSQSVVDASRMPAPAQVQAVSPERTRDFVDSMYRAQVGMAVRRNVLITGPHNVSGTAINYSVLANSYDAAMKELAVCGKKLAALRANAKLVHPDALAYAARLDQLLSGRHAYMARLRDAARNETSAPVAGNFFPPIYNDFRAFEDRELAALNAIEAMMVKRIGDELSIAASDRNQLYQEILKGHEAAVIDKLRDKRTGDIYTMIVDSKWSYGTWTFEFGELRESRMGRPLAADGAVSLKYDLHVVGASGLSQNMSLTLYFTVDAVGTLRLIGLR